MHVDEAGADHVTASIDYPARLDGGGVAANYSDLVPGNAQGGPVPGLAGAVYDLAELARMQELAREGLRDGAFGFSTGLW